MVNFCLRCEYLPSCRDQGGLYWSYFGVSSHSPDFRRTPILKRTLGVFVLILYSLVLLALDRDMSSKIDLEAGLPQ